MKTTKFAMLAFAFLGLPLAVLGQGSTTPDSNLLPLEPRSATIWQKPPGWFESVPGGWRSVNSPWQVSIASNLNQLSAISLITPEDHVSFRAVPVALSYVDPVTQSNVLIALPKNSVGYLAASNQVIFPDCWEGSPGVACRYTLRHHSFSQDILIQGELPDPTRYGMKPAGLRIQVWSESTESPEPQIRTRTLLPESQTNTMTRSGDTTDLPPWIDEHLSFGKAAMIAGKAFVQALPQTGKQQTINLVPRVVPVVKRWIKSGQRTFIVEEIDYEQVKLMQKQLNPVKPMPMVPVRKPQSSLGKPFKLPPELPEHAVAVGAGVPSRPVAIQTKNSPQEIFSSTIENQSPGALKTLPPGVQFLTQNHVVIDWSMEVDTDSDGLPDDWEYYYFGNLDQGAGDDYDNDGLNNGSEYFYEANPTVGDTDGDGISDGDEVNTYGTNPASGDSDGDGISDYSEIFTHGTNPNSTDSDGDGLSDNDELSVYGSNPNSTDSDNDGMPDGWEVQYGLIPNYDDAGGDADSDGLSNLAEYQNGTNPYNADTDGDGLTDNAELNYNTNPNNSDSDGDGLTDGQEVNTYGTNPNSTDSDNDGMPDLWEVQNNLNPNNANDAGIDSDGDYFSNLQEYQMGTNPNSIVSDGDGLGDYAEVNIFYTNPTLADSDGDGLNDYDEIYVYGTNPNNSDCDSDGMNDGWEIQNNFDPLNSLDGPLDADQDGLTNAQECQYGSNPRSSDTDGDTISDYDEVATGTNPAKADTDDDGLRDDLEYVYSTNPNNPDTDGDGMPDGWEVAYGYNPLANDSEGDTDGDGLTNGQEYGYGTNPLDKDTDYDGRTDYFEIAYDSTNPTDAASVAPVLLGHWRFDAELFAGEQGQLPLSTNGTTVVSGLNSNAVNFFGTNAFVKYRDEETNGSANFNCRSGTIMLYYKPEWSSISIGGNGPGREVNLIELGGQPNDNSLGNWRIAIGAQGTNLYLLTQTNGQAGSKVVEARITLTNNVWSWIVLSYNPEASVLYTNGVVAASGTGTQYWPSKQTRSAGFFVGGGWFGTNGALGTIDELETYNYPLAAQTVSTLDSDGDGLANGLEMVLGINPYKQDSDGDGLSDNWEVSYGTNPAVNDLHMDLDGDGLTNLEEYLAGTHPNRRYQIWDEGRTNRLQVFTPLH